MGLALALLLTVAPAVADDLYAVPSRDGALVLTNVPPAGGRGRALHSTGAERERVPATARRPAPAPRVRPYDEVVRRVAGRFGVDHDLVHAVISVESAYDPRAVSPKGAVGLMQLMPATAAELGVHDLTDPHDNIVGGVRHLRRLLAYYKGDLTRALAAYNAGVGAVDRHGGVPPYRETRDYVRRVQSRYQGSGLSGGAQGDPIYTYVDARGTVVFTQYPPAGGASGAGGRP